MSKTIAAQHCSVCAYIRAEVKRLQHINAELLKQKDGVDKDLFGVVCFERDEALAQVAVLMQTCEELADRIVALDASARILIPQGLPKARALLDRLQRAEAVIEAAQSLIPHGYLNPDGGLEEAFPRHYVDSLRKALAAYGESK